MHWINVDLDDYPFSEANDNRSGKYSHRLYSKVAFKDKQEYDLFIRLLKENVRPGIAPMIDPTSSMLRTPGSWKDDHCCKWITSGSKFTDSIISPAYMCDVLELDEENRELLNETPDYFGELSDEMYRGTISRVLALDGIAGVFAPGKNTGRLITLRRLEPGYCRCCKTEHDKIDSFCLVAGNGHVYLGCYNIKRHQGKTVDLGELLRGENYIGIVGQHKPISIEWSSVKEGLKNMRKAMKNKPTSGLSKAETRALENEQKSAINTMIDLAEKNQKELDREVFYYGDSKYIHKRVFTDETVLSKYVEQVIVKIESGGNSFYISKDRWKDSTHYTEIKHAPWTGTDEIEYEIINPSFDRTECVSKFNPLVVKRKLSALCLDHVKCHNFRTVDFVPSLEPVNTTDNGEVFNLFEGYRFKYEKREANSTLIQPFIDHIVAVFAGRNEAMGKIVLQWFAHLIQKPTQKGYALLVQGGQGSGKSLVYEIFKRCIGSGYAIQFTKMGDLTQTHNNIVRGRLLINLNEAVNYPSIENVNILKGLITDEELLINPKCCPLYYVSNFSRVLITTNCEFAMRIDPGDRRYLCLRSNDEFIGNTEYFDNLVDLMNNDEFLNELFIYFANLDITDFKFNRPPMTGYKRQLITSQLPDIYYFMQDVIEGEIGGADFEDGEAFVTKDTLFAGYRGYCERNGIKPSGVKDFLRDLQGEKFKMVRVHRQRHGVRARGFIINKEAMLKIYKRVLGADFEFECDE
jgi:hypothetical protein